MFTNSNVYCLDSMVIHIYPIWMVYFFWLSVSFWVEMWCKSLYKSRFIKSFWLLFSYRYDRVLYICSFIPWSRVTVYSCLGPVFRKLIIFPSWDYDYPYRVLLLHSIIRSLYCDYQYFVFVILDMPLSLSNNPLKLKRTQTRYCLVHLFFSFQCVLDLLYYNVSTV